jgi:hypothetical protein
MIALPQLVEDLYETPEYRAYGREAWSPPLAATNFLIDPLPKAELSTTGPPNRWKFEELVVGDVRRK